MLLTARLTPIRGASTLPRTGVPHRGTVPYDGTQAAESSPRGSTVSRVQSIERAFAVLAALTDGPVGVTDVAERADLPKSTAARMLASLAREGAVEQVPGDTRYRLGPRIEALASGFGSTHGLIAIARPHLAELAASLGEAAGLSVPDGREVHYIDQVDSPTRTPSGSATGPARASRCTPSRSGLVFLAYRPAAAVERYLAEPLRRPDRADGHGSRGDPRAAPGDRAAPGTPGSTTSSRWASRRWRPRIADPNGEVVAAIHVHGPSYRFPPPGREAALGLAVATTAGRIGRSLRQAVG